VATITATPVRTTPERKAPDSAAADRAGRRDRNARARRTAQIVERLAGASGDDRRILLDELIEVNMGVARSVAARYRHRGVATDDLDQVAYAALVRAAHAFDPGAGHDFLSYAVPSMRGEVRRYFRDCGWMVRPPRRIQELQSRLTGAESVLATALGHPPRAEDLAIELDEPVADVEEALAANGCFTPTSLDQAIREGGTSSIGDGLGGDEGGYDAAEARVALQPALQRLGERDRRIVTLRFFGQCTQQEIADDIGVTQMQVSRLLSSIFDKLRAELSAEVDPPAA
jgi:RNA polymerase sigma-B factor